MKHEKPWLEAKPAERLLNDLRIALQQGDWLFAGALADELRGRVGEMTNQQLEELKQIAESWPSTKA